MKDILKNCFVFDTTLRDGSQAEGISFSIDDKLQVAQLLDDFGIDYIEGGWPGSNPKDTDFFKKIKKVGIKHSKITVFGSTRRADQKITQDNSIQKTVSSEADVACIFGKSWDIHVNQALQISLDQNLEIIFESINYLKKYFKEVIFDLEHFFDGYLGNKDYCKKVLITAQEAGADFVVLCDTNGGVLPWQVQDIIHDLQGCFKVPYGIHAHNDSDVAVSNSLVAIKNGASMVQGTINGFGERCGNANLVSIIANAQLKMGMTLVKPENIRNLTKLSREISEIANQGDINRQAYSGFSAFAHKGGIHVSAVLKNPRTYEHIEPESVGNKRRVLVSELSGKANINFTLDSIDFPIVLDDISKKNILIKIKDLENKGYVFEGAAASLELFMLRECKQLPNYFNIIGYRVIDEKLSLEHEPLSIATVKYKFSMQSEISAGEGLGPVDSMSIALLDGLGKYYPSLKRIKLVDYKVRILDSKKGTASSVRVLISFSDGVNNWNTIGVGFDVISASFLALTDGIEYSLYQDKQESYNKISDKIG